MTQSGPGEGEPLRSEMVDYLVEVVRSRPQGRGLQTGVNAARFVIQAIDTRRTPEQTLVEILGSEQAALDWMREMIPKLEAKLARQQMRQLEQGNGET